MVEMCAEPRETVDTALAGREGAIRWRRDVAAGRALHAGQHTYIHECTYFARTIPGRGNYEPVTQLTAALGCRGHSVAPTHTTRDITDDGARWFIGTIAYGDVTAAGGHRLRAGFTSENQRVVVVGRQPAATEFGLG
jgi:hypothetical protein